MYTEQYLGVIVARQNIGFGNGRWADGTLAVTKGRFSAFASVTAHLTRSAGVDGREGTLAGAAGTLWGTTCHTTADVRREAQRALFGWWFFQPAIVQLTWITARFLTLVHVVAAVALFALLHDFVPTIGQIVRYRTDTANKINLIIIGKLKI